MTRSAPGGPAGRQAAGRGDPAAGGASEAGRPASGPSATVCPSCGAALPSGATSCPRCGEPLVSPERKLVTLLFADLSGYTSLASGLDPEEVFTVVRPWMTSLRLIVEAHGGSVPQVMGDGFMAVFGVPTAHEDDAERAVRAALALVREAAALARAETGVPFPGLHVGVNTGEVMVVGSREASGFGVVGDAVNLSARLADRATSGEVLVGAATRALTGGAIRYTRRRRVDLKGIAGPVEVYAAIAANDRDRRRRRSGKDLPGAGVFVDRVSIIRRLVAAARRAERRGQVQVRAIVDEPGVGKTRLAEELGSRLPEALVLVGRCHPYGQRLPLTALGDAVASALGIATGLPPSRLHRAIQRSLQRPGAPQATAGLVAQLETLLGGPGAGGASSTAGTVVGAAPIDARGAVRPVLRALGRGRPVVVVLDDVHWADPELVTLLADLARAPWPEPFLFLALGRPEPDRWHTGIPRIALGGLPPAEARRILRGALGAPAPGSLVDRLVARAGGNPLFLEESARMLVERGALVRAGSEWRVAEASVVDAVPASLRLLVTARLDALPLDEKRVLQDASIAGEVTWDGLILQLARARDGRRDDAAVLAAIDRLRARDLLRAREASRVAGAQELESKHAVIRDVAYESLPLTDRATRHRIAAEWLREHLGDVAVAAVAHHYLRSWELGRSRAWSSPDPGLGPIAAEYLRRWADLVLVFQPRLAGSIYARALEIVDAEPAGMPHDLVVRLHVGRAESLSELGRHADAIHDAEDARALLDPADPARGYVLLALGRAHSDLGDVGAARGSIQEALALFRAAGDTFGQARALHRLAEASRFDDFATESRSYRDAFRLYRMAGMRGDATAVAGDLAYLLTVAGGSQFERWFRRARHLVEQGGSERGLAALSRAWAYACWYRGDLDGALRAALEARGPAAEAGDRWLEVDTILVEALVRSVAGSPAEADRLVRQLVRIADSVGARHLRALALLAGARPALRAGRPALARRRLAAARRALVELGVAMELAEADLAGAWVDLDRGAWDTAIALADAAEARARSNGWRLLVPLSSLVKARAHLGAGRLAASRAELRRVVRLARALGATGPLAVAGATARQVERLLDGRIASTEEAREMRARIERLSSIEPIAIQHENDGLRWLEEDPARASEAFARASRAWAALGITVWQARAELFRARALEAAGQPERARAGRRRSDDLVAALGSSPDVLASTLERPPDRPP